MTTTEPLDLNEIEATLADNGIDGPDQPYNPRALAAMRAADKLFAEVKRLRADLGNAEARRQALWEVVANQQVHEADRAEACRDVGDIENTCYHDGRHSAFEAVGEHLQTDLTAPIVGGLR